MRGPWRPLQATISVPVFALAIIIGGLGFLGAASDPTPVTAAPFTCRISKTFTMPTMEQLSEQYSGDREDPIPSEFSFVAGVDTRCRRNLTKGLYAYRMKVTTSTQISTRWPEDISEYPQGFADAAFYAYPIYNFYAPGSENDFNDWGSPVTDWPSQTIQLSPGQLGTHQAQGAWYSDLTELCIGERCLFTGEHGGTFFQPTTGGDFGLMLSVTNTCAPIVPVELEATILCQEEGFYPPEEPATYFHPGLSGARFTVNATLLFEPLMTWR